MAPVVADHRALKGDGSQSSVVPFFPFHVEGWSHGDGVRVEEEDEGLIV